jgi:hypothetical protein
MRDLDASEKRVLEGSHVECELDFAGFILNSGIVSLLRDTPIVGESDLHTERLRKLFHYDGYALWAKADKLRLLCGQYFEGRTKDSLGTAAGVPRSELEAINHKLDVMAAGLSKLTSVADKKRKRKNSNRFLMLDGR